MRFRVRSLMFAVAGVAIASAVTVKRPEIAAVCGLLAALSVGPWIASVWAGLRYQTGRLDPLNAGVAGGMLQATLLALVLESLATGPHDISRLFVIWVVLLVLHAVTGFFVGSLACFFFTIGGPARKTRPAQAQHSEEGIFELTVSLSDWGDCALRDPGAK